MLAVQFRYQFPHVAKRSVFLVNRGKVTIRNPVLSASSDDIIRDLGVAPTFKRHLQYWELSAKASKVANAYRALLHKCLQYCREAYTE